MHVWVVYIYLSAMGAQVVESSSSSSSSLLDLQRHTKTLTCALNFLSHNLPLPPDVFHAVSSIYTDSPPAIAGFHHITQTQHLQGESPISNEGDLMTDLEDALAKQWPSHISGSELAEARENRVQSYIQHRLTELEGSLTWNKAFIDIFEVPR
ncbi:hypothetical protein OSB04_031167 [Centaurea solstitialis]|uniref:Uncharacterized protein n=1 Tax=Centaurea solstitialis TaxID=347529 RepID=A0AA38SA78_9ASTR|nr:hypothetical protein OSB04_031167 [Centaurea solstitialis]